jgi:hypothetical protein
MNDRDFDFYAYMLLGILVGALIIRLILCLVGG